MSHPATHEAALETVASRRASAVRRYGKRNSLLRSLGYARYGDYLRSPHWRRLRATYRASTLPQSCICGEEQVQLHHLTYVRVGAERLSDLVPLCSSCHSLVHVLEWRGDTSIAMEGLTDEQRAVEGRAWLTEQVEARRAEMAVLEAQKRQDVLAQPFASRLVAAVATAKRRHMDVSHDVHVLGLAVRNGSSSDRLTRRLRVIEAKVYDWDDWFLT